MAALQGARQPGAAIVRRLNLKTVLREVVGHQRGEFGIVFDEQDRFGEGVTSSVLLYRNTRQCAALLQTKDAFSG